MKTTEEHAAHSKIVEKYSHKHRHLYVVAKHVHIKAGFHMIVTIAEKKFSDRCNHMETTLQRS